MAFIIFGIYLFLAVFSAGNMMTLQVQHYGIYQSVERRILKHRCRRTINQHSSPSILPAMLLMLVNIIIIFIRPAFMPETIIFISLFLNIMAFASTVIWQRKLQGEIAVTGYDERKILLLISTNWIRTIAFLLQAILVVTVTMNALK